MAERTLIAPSQCPIQPLVEGALRNELCRLEAGIWHSAQRRHECEARHGLSTVDFLQRYEEKALEETRAYAE